MNTRSFLLSIGFVLAVTLPVARAGQQESHQGAASSAQPDPRIAECAQAQGVVTATVEATLKRLQEAELTNSPAALRAAADDVEAALLDVRTRLEPCAMMSAAVSPHGGHSMPNVQTPSASPGTSAQPGSTVPRPDVVAPRVPAPAATEPHGGHMPPSRPAVPPAVPAPRRNRSGAASPATPPRATPPAATDSHAGHATPTATAGTKSPAPASRSEAPSSPATPPSSGSSAAPRARDAMTTAAAPATAIGDLRCQNEVDPKTAPRMLYQGRMYYFCTESDRVEFAKDPARYVTAPPQKVPAHAH
jgi:YHS domain-containing protein